MGKSSGYLIGFSIELKRGIVVLGGVLPILQLVLIFAKHGASRTLPKTTDVFLSDIHINMKM